MTRESCAQEVGIASTQIGDPIGAAQVDHATFSRPQCQLR